MNSRRIYRWGILIVLLVVSVTGYPNRQPYQALHQQKDSDVVDLRLQTIPKSAAHDNRRDDEENYMMPNMLDTMYGGFGKK